jgi:hypothetical protein
VVTRTFDVTRSADITVTLTADDLAEADAIGETPEQFAEALADLMPLTAWDYHSPEVTEA